MGMLTVTALEAVTLGVLAGGCRLAFAAPEAFAARSREVRRFARRLERLGGALVRVQSDAAAAQMAAGASLTGLPSVALVTDAATGACALTGVDDLSPVLVDVSGRLPLGLHQIRVALAPYSPREAFDAGRSVLAQARALRGPGLIAGLGAQSESLEIGLLWETRALPAVPIRHEGPDNPDILLLSAGPGCEACAVARGHLEREGVAAAHLQVLQLLPFPAAVIAPVLTSASRVLVVEPGGPGTLSGLVRSHLGAPIQPFAELHRLAGAPLGAAEVAWRAQEVMAL